MPEAAFSVKVIGGLSPGFLRVVIGRGQGMMDGGSEQDWPEQWIPPEERRPNGEFWVSGFREGIPQIVKR